jgi:hypothetical protein
MKTKPESQRGDRGSVVLMVMVLLAAISGLIICNTHTLYMLKRELVTIEKQQTRHWTNAPAIRQP